MPAELSTLDAARQLVANVAAEFGRIDALVHLVGGFEGGKSIADSDDAIMDRMFDINFRPAYHVIRAVLPAMRSQQSGRIIAIAARAALEPVATLGAYSVSKAALVLLIKTVALENKDRGISANAVLPGTMDTPANRTAMPKADVSKWVQPAQVAALLVHLASDQASNITGAAIPILGSSL
jgi:NAD(P)-dependent dehydrogenase (short-subunit alcohol dehydrogenase family)